MKPIPCFFLLALGALTASAQTNVQAPPPARITAGVGFDYSRGDYGFTADTEYLSVPLNLSFENGPWTLRASLPYVTLRGPATVVGGGGTPRPTSQSESGAGDISVGATYAAGPILGELQASFTARVKLPTANEDRGLGTGEADFYGQFDFYRNFGQVTPYATVGYRALGDSATYPLKSGLYLGAGSHFRLSPATVLTVGVDWGQRILAGGDPTTSAIVAVATDFGAGWQFSFYGLKGFTDASPDYGGGLAVNYRF